MRWIAIVCILLVATVSFSSEAIAYTQNFKTAHFTVYYKTDKPDYDLYSIESTIESCYRYIDRYFNTCPDRVKLVIIQKSEMDEIGEHVEAFSAWNKKVSAIVIREDTLKNKKDLDVVLKHELCHLALNYILDSKDSTEYSWMEEGICMVMSNDPLDDGKVARYIITKGFMDIDDIPKAVDSKSYSDSKNGYIQSFSLCKYIARVYGVDALVAIIKSPEKSFNEAFKQVTGDDFSSFYVRWKYHVRSLAGNNYRNGVRYCIDTSGESIDLYYDPR